MKRHQQQSSVDAPKIKRSKITNDNDENLFDIQEAVKSVDKFLNTLEELKKSKHKLESENTKLKEELDTLNQQLLNSQEENQRQRKKGYCRYLKLANRFKNVKEKYAKMQIKEKETIANLEKQHNDKMEQERVNRELEHSTFNSVFDALTATNDALKYQLLNAQRNEKKLQEALLNLKNKKTQAVQRAERIAESEKRTKEEALKDKKVLEVRVLKLEENNAAAKVENDQLLNQIREVTKIGENLQQCLLPRPNENSRNDRQASNEAFPKWQNESEKMVDKTSQNLKNSQNTSRSTRGP